MPDRLSPLDVSFLYFEEPTTPMHVGGVAIFQAPEAGFDYEYAFGDFKPDFGGGFVPQVADDAISKSNNVPVGSLGFAGRFGGWNSLEKRTFKHNHLKAYFKVRF